MNAHTLIIESKWGESKFHFNKPMCLHDIKDLLKMHDFQLDVLSESGGVARVFDSRSFVDVYDLVLRLIDMDDIVDFESKLVKDTSDVYPALAKLAPICEEVKHAAEASSVGGTVPEETEEKEEQSGEAPEGNQLHSANGKDDCGYSAAQCCQRQEEAGGDSKHFPVHHTRDEMSEDQVASFWHYWITVFAWWGVVFLVTRECLRVFGVIQ